MVRNKCIYFPNYISLYIFLFTLFISIIECILTTNNTTATTTTATTTTANNTMISTTTSKDWNIYFQN